jgi:hypothetical protein
MEPTKKSKTINGAFFLLAEQTALSGFLNKSTVVDFKES